MGYEQLVTFHVVLRGTTIRRQQRKSQETLSDNTFGKLKEEQEPQPTYKNPQYKNNDFQLIIDFKL